LFKSIPENYQGGDVQMLLFHKYLNKNIISGAWYNESGILTFEYEGQ